MVGMDINTSTSTLSKAIDGAVFYKKRCSLCHGEKAKKTPLKNMVPLVGMDASILARKIRAYRDQDEMYGIAHNVYESNQMMKDATYSLSDRHISAIAVYISQLKYFFLVCIMKNHSRKADIIK
jgi:cytochrome c553